MKKRITRNYVISKANLYNNVKDDKTAYLAILEDIVKKYDDYEALGKLVDYYNDSNQKEEVKMIILNRLKTYPYMNNLRDSYISILTNENKYEEALQYIDDNLAEFPYSFEKYGAKSRCIPINEKQ